MYIHMCCVRTGYYYLYRTSLIHKCICICLCRLTNTTKPQNSICILHVAAARDGAEMPGPTYNCSTLFRGLTMRPPWLTIRRRAPGVGAQSFLTGETAGRGARARENPVHRLWGPAGSRLLPAAEQAGVTGPRARGSTDKACRPTSRSASCASASPRRTRDTTRGPTMIG